MEETTSLDQFPAGSRVEIDSLCDCPKARCRLCAMGLTPGTVVEVLSSGNGPCDIRVRGSRLVLGYGLASRVYAHLVNGNGKGDASWHKKKRFSFEKCREHCRKIDWTHRGRQ